MTTIILDSTLKRIPYRGLNDTQERTRDLDMHHGLVSQTQNQLKKVDASKSYTNVKPLLDGPFEESDYKPTQSFLYMLSTAYSIHAPIEIAPHDMWYIILTELARIIKANPEACRPLFTRSPETETIMVLTSDPTRLDVTQLTTILREHVPVDVDLFVPNFTTHTRNSYAATCAAFCDSMQVYYNYMTFACGIPSITITGTDADWGMAVDNLRKIAVEFSKCPNMERHVDWMTEVLGILTNFRDHRALVNGVEDFWKHIFTQHNVGSGRQLEISGWITKLFHSKDPRASNKLVNFSNTVSVVPYKNKETGRKYVVTFGAFKECHRPDGTLYVDYGNMVFEVTEAVEQPKTDSDKPAVFAVLRQQVGESKVKFPVVHRTVPILD